MAPPNQTTMFKDTRVLGPAGDDGSIPIAQVFDVPKLEFAFKTVETNNGSEKHLVAKLDLGLLTSEGKEIKNVVSRIGLDSVEKSFILVSKSALEEKLLKCLPEPAGVVMPDTKESPNEELLKAVGSIRDTVDQVLRTAMPRKRSAKSGGGAKSKKVKREKLENSSGQKVKREKSEVIDGSKVVEGKEEDTGEAQSKGLTADDLRGYPVKQEEFEASADDDSE